MLTERQVKEFEEATTSGTRLLVSFMRLNTVVKN